MRVVCCFVLCFLFFFSVIFSDWGVPKRGNCCSRDLNPMEWFGQCEKYEMITLSFPAQDFLGGILFYLSLDI